MHVKVCGITQLDQLSALDSMGVDYAGFIFYARSPRFIGASSLEPEMVRTANMNIKRIGVFVNETKEKILQAVDEWGLSAVQLHGEESPVFCEQIANHVQTIKAFRVNELASLNYKVAPYQDVVEYFLFDAMGEQYGGTGKQFNWKLIQEASINKPFFLSGGIGIDDMGSVKAFGQEHANCYAVDVNSRFEIKPGIKNMELVKSFVDSLSK